MKTTHLGRFYPPPPPLLLPGGNYFPETNRKIYGIGRLQTGENYVKIHW